MSKEHNVRCFYEITLTTLPIYIIMTSSALLVLGFLNHIFIGFGGIFFKWHRRQVCFDRGGLCRNVQGKSPARQGPQDPWGGFLSSQKEASGIQEEVGWPTVLVFLDLRGSWNAELSVLKTRKSLLYRGGWSG